MLKNLLTFAALTAVVGACGGESAGADPAAQTGSALVPRGATIGPSGYATILDAPTAPFTPATPKPPEPLSADRVAAHEQFRRGGEFQNSVMDEVQALAERLRRAEKGNFVDLYFENEGEPHVVFRFLRNGPETLAKYTRHPRFRAATARYSMEELKAALDFMMETFREDRVIVGGGIGNKQNRATITINVPEREFRELVARKDVKIPDAVELEFAADRSASEINQPLPSKIAPLVRVFPRDDRPLGILNAISSTAKVVLQDGCFRSPDQRNALVLFPLGAQLFIDSEGYLAYGSGETPGYARVGEELVFPGSIAEVTAPELVGPIHAACGPGKVIKVNGMRSSAAERAQERVSTNANSLRQLQKMYGLSEPVARKALETCKAQMGFGTCLLTPPRPMRKDECPEGTTLNSGLCRTPEGFVRPLPGWLQELVERSGG